MNRRVRRERWRCRYLQNQVVYLHSVTRQERICGQDMMRADRTGHGSGGRLWIEGQNRTEIEGQTRVQRNEGEEETSQPAKTIIVIRKCINQNA